MTSRRVVILLGAWNLVLLVAWFGRFHPVPGQLVAVVGANFPSPSGWLATLAGNWVSFLAAVTALTGMVGLAGIFGRTAAGWFGARGEEELGELAVYGIGFGLAALVVLGAGLDGLLFAPPRAVSVSLLAVAGFLELGRTRRLVVHLASAFEWPAMPRPAGAALALLMAASLVGILNIELGWDALTYHLRLPSFYLYRHKFYDVWHSYYAFFPSNIEMLFLAGQATGGDILARLLNAFFGLLLLAATARTARALGTPSCWPVTVLACSPLFLLLVTRCYADLGTAFFIATAVLMLLRWWETGSVPALLAGGALAGLGMGSKLSAVAFWFAVAFAAAPRLLRGPGRRDIALWNAALVPMFVPWLARSFLLRGNPVYPFLSPFLGLPAARAGDYVLPFEGLSAAGSTVRNTLWARLEGVVFDAGHIEGPMIAAFGGMLPFLAMRPAGDGGAFARRLVLAYLVLWFTLFPEIRFLLPVVPAVLSLCVGGLSRAVPGSGVVAGWGRGVLVAGSLLGALVAACLQFRDFQPFTMACGLERPAEKVRRLILPSPYTGYLSAAVSERVPREDRILFLCHFSSYYVERECITDVHFGRARITDIIREGRTADGIARQLRRRGIGWLLLTGSGAAIFRHVPGYFDVPGGAWAEWKRMMEERTEVVWQTNYYVLIRMTARHEPRPLAVLPVYEALEFARADEDLQAGRLAEAAAAYLKPPPLLEDVGSRWSRLGMALGGMERHAEALRACENADTLGFRPPRMLWGMAVSLLRMNRPDDAARIAEEAWNMDPLSARTAALRATIEAAQGRQAEALSWVEKALKLDPGSAEYWVMKERLRGRGRMGTGR